MEEKKGLKDVLNYVVDGVKKFHGEHPKLTYTVGAIGGLGVLYTLKVGSYLVSGATDIDNVSNDTSIVYDIIRDNLTGSQNISDIADNIVNNTDVSTLRGEENYLNDTGVMSAHTEKILLNDSGVVVDAIEDLNKQKGTEVVLDCVDGHCVADEVTKISEMPSGYGGEYLEKGIYLPVNSTNGIEYGIEIKDISTKCDVMLDIINPATNEIYSRIIGLGEDAIVKLGNESMKLSIGADEKNIFLGTDSPLVKLSATMFKNS